MFNNSRDAAFPYTHPAAYAPVHHKGDVQTFDVLTLDEIKEHLGLPVSDTSRDAELIGFRATAIAALEQYLEVSIPFTEWRADVPMLFDQMRLTKRPFARMTQIEFVSGESQDIPAATLAAAPTAEDGELIVDVVDLERDGTVAAGQDPSENGGTLPPVTGGIGQSSSI